MRTIASILFAAVLMMGSCGKPEDPATYAPRTEPVAAEPAKPVEALKPVYVRPIVTERLFFIPAGTRIRVRLLESISTETAQTGYHFATVLSAPIVSRRTVVVPEDTRITGLITDVDRSGKVKGRAGLRLVLMEITDGNKVYPIVTQTIALKAKGSKGKDAGIIGGAAGIGAVIGGILGGKDGAVKGSVIGGVAGTGAVLGTRGTEIELEDGLNMTFVLQRAASLPKIY